MRTLRVFLVHELTTQLRSARFWGVTLSYLLVSTAPAVISFILERRVQTLMGPGLYGALMDAIQPLATTLLAAAMAVDIIARERDENSLAVISMAPLSATGYVLRRWLALLLLMLPLTLLPRAIAIALVAQAQGGLQDVAPILWGWALYVAPLLTVMTAYATGLGTITGRTVLALIFGFGVFTVGFGIGNDLLANFQRQIEGPGAFFGIGDLSMVTWAIRGYVDVATPSAAGFPLAAELEVALLDAAMAIAAAVFFLGISCAYLRRTKRDIRPWRIREDNQFRSFLRTLNRIREEYAPDGALEIPEKIAIAVALIVPVIAVVLITRRHNAFEQLAFERYQAETKGVAPMPAEIVPPSASLRGRITPSGDIHATATIALRNDGTVPQRELAFALNRGIVIDRVTASKGTAHVQRLWERVGIVVDPPLAPRETRSVAFVLSGAPGTYDFSLPSARTYAGSWRRYSNAIYSFDMADLSRSRLRRDATAQRMLLGGARLLPVPRYSPWEVVPPRWGRGQLPAETYLSDAIEPLTSFSIELDVPPEFTAVDSCGTASKGHLSSRCTSSLVDYVLIGTRLDTATLAEGVRLAYLPSHARLAEKHGPALAGAVDLAQKSWPGFRLPDRTIFVERPSYAGETYFDDYYGMNALRSISTIGALGLLPETMFTRLKPLETERVAAGLIAGHLQRRRLVAVEELGFFHGLYETLAVWRTGGKKPSPVESAGGPRPLIDPIIAEGNGGWRGPVRLRKVLVDVEYRIGSERLIQGVEDFLAAGPGRGTAKELLDAIGRRGGVSLDRVYTDYFMGKALPKLTLENVTFTRVDGGWETRGSLRNEAEGEVFCPLVVRTAFGAARGTVRVDTKSATPFVLRTPQEPRTVQLDPDGVVYRHAAVGLVGSVDNNEGGS